MAGWLPLLLPCCPCRPHPPSLPRSHPPGAPALLPLLLPSLPLQAPTSLQWYLEVYPQLPPEQRPLEVVQQPGDTIFLPAGGWAGGQAGGCGGNGCGRAGASVGPLPAGWLRFSGVAIPLGINQVEAACC